MEGREGMSSTPYYLQRGGGTVNHHHHHHGLHLQSGFMPVTNTNNISVQSNVRDNTSTHFAHGFNVSSSNSSSPAVAAAAAAAASTVMSVELVKKKRGRPRKYGPDGSNVSLGLSPLSSKSPVGETTTPNPKKRGRPPGSGRKQQLSSLGEWMNSSAGQAFAPHVMHIAAGEDVASKVLSFSQQRSRAVCILSATGTVSAVSLRQPTSSANNVTYEGRFQILCLSGSYLVAENGGPRNRTGGISVSLCSSDGHVIGGAVGGVLTAAGPVQVVLCSFTYGGGGFKAANEKQPELISPKPELKTEDITSSSSPPKRSNAPSSGQNLSLSSSSGMMSGLRQNTRNPQMDIDLMRG